MLSSVPSRSGHFLLESGYHTNLWFTLDALFAEPSVIAPLVARLADKLRVHEPSVVCGPLLGGAFLAQLVAIELHVHFAYTEPVMGEREASLFEAEYRLPSALGETVRGRSVAVVDDVMSAGSSLRATVSSLVMAGARPVVIGALAVLGETGLDYFSELGLAVETLERREFELWEPSSCPRCLSGVPLERP